MTDQPGADALQTRVRKLLQPIVTRLWDFELTGFDRLPAQGPAILCPNHISFIDSLFLMSLAPRNVSFVGKAEYLDDWKTRKLFPALGMIPIDRSGGSKSEGALAAAQRVLQRGELFAIYPEGTRSRDGHLYKGRTGAARLALATGVPIFPIGISGTAEIQPVDTLVPKIRRAAAIRIGRPIKPQRYQGRGPDHVAWRSMIDEVMFEIRELSGQEYRNHYAGEDPDDKPTRIGSVNDSTPPKTAERELVGVG